MTTIQVQLGTVANTMATPSASQSNALDSQFILPEPAAEATLDDIAGLYAVMADGRRAARANAFADASGKREAIRRAREAMLEAIKKAEEEKEDGGMFGAIGDKLGTAGKIAAIAGAVALVVGTGGAGLAGVLAISAVALSSAAFAQSEFQVLQKMGVDDKTAMYTELSLIGASALCSGGAGVAAIAGASTAATAAQTATQLEKGAQLVGGGCAIVSGGCNAGSAYAGWRAGEAFADAEDKLADAAAERAKEERLERLLSQLIDQIEDDERSDRRTADHIRGAAETKATTLMMVAQKV